MPGSVLPGRASVAGYVGSLARCAGSLPQAWGNLTNLAEVDLHANALTGIASPGVERGALSAISKLLPWRAHCKPDR